MRLFGYYRQFEALTPEEVSAGLRERAAERRAKELAVVEPLDLASTTWPGLPHPDVVGAITFAARRGLNTYADRRAQALRSELGHLVGVQPERIVVGTGAAQLLQAASYELLEAGDELVTPWPSYGLFPVMARRARGHAVPVSGWGPEAILAAVNERTRAVALCNPNDPTGELVDAGALRGLLDALPERVVVLLDEALVDFVDAQGREASLALLEDYPRLLVFRTFSKAWGLAGLRCGYAIGGPGAEPLLERLAPDVALNDLAQAGALEAVRTTAGQVQARAAAVAAERARLTGEIRARGLDVTPSQANVLWIAAPDGDGSALADRLANAGVHVAAGGSLGDPERVRVTVRNLQASQRFLRALDAAL